jgi:hypothetical protein
MSKVSFSIQATKVKLQLPNETVLLSNITYTRAQKHIS